MTATTQEKKHRCWLHNHLWEWKTISEKLKKITRFSSIFSTIYFFWAFSMYYYLKFEINKIKSFIYSRQPPLMSISEVHRGLLIVSRELFQASRPYYFPDFFLIEKKSWFKKKSSLKKILIFSWFFILYCYSTISVWL